MPVSQLYGGTKLDDDEKTKTFVFEDEGHTLGNALRCIISSYPDVEFCAYTVPHPAESKMNFRIQMYKGNAHSALTRGLEDLVKMCDHTLATFEREVGSYKKQHNIVT